MDSNNETPKKLPRLGLYQKAKFLIDDLSIGNHAGNEKVLIQDFICIITIDEGQYQFSFK